MSRDSIQRQLMELKVVDWPKGRTGYEFRSICNGQLIRLMPGDSQHDAINFIQINLAFVVKIPLANVLRRQLAGESAAFWDNWVDRRRLQHR